MVTIRLNGERHELADMTTVAKLLEELGLQPELLAVERNRDIVPKAAYGETVFEEGDVVEIVTFVGGG
ncbi:MAG: sulfur carrier protein ThiS [Candidatus Tectimicrobiota bacterium]